MSTGRDRGQAAVEFAIVAPAVVVLALGIVQVAAIAGRHLVVEHLARSAARAASAAAEPAAAARAHVADATDLDVGVEVAVTDDRVTVTVTYTDPTSVPIIGRVLGDVELSATATMPVEPP